MKAIIAIIFLFNLQISYSQTDSKKDESSQDEKPSWGTRMPTREAAPDLKFDADLDDDEEGEDDFGMDRSRMLESEDAVMDAEDSINLERPVFVTAEESAKIDEDKKEQAKIKEQQAEEAIIAAEQLKIQEKRAEDERIAADLQRAQEAKVAEAKIAAEQLKEQQRLDEEKRIADQIAKEGSKSTEPVKEEVAQDGTADEQDQLSEVVVTAPVLAAYQWKKIKNALPVYPTKAAREKKEGWVEVKVTINAAGEVVDTSVVRSSRNYRIFNNAALKAVRKWKFEPPGDYGIDNQLSKVVRIVFQL